MGLFSRRYTSQIGFIPCWCGYPWLAVEYSIAILVCDSNPIASYDDCESTDFTTGWQQGRQENGTPHDCSGLKPFAILR